LIHGSWKLRAPRLAAAVVPVPEAAVVAVVDFFELEPHASSKAGPATPSRAAPPRKRPPFRRNVLRSTGSGM
jgi:hypothetical protein